MPKKPNRKLRGLRYQQRGHHKKFVSPEYRIRRGLSAADAAERITRALRAKETGNGDH